MEKTIEQLAEEYADNTIGFSNENNHLLEPCKRDFIAGHTAASEGMVSKSKIEYIVKLLSIQSPTSAGSMYNQALTDVLTEINNIK